MLKLRAHLSAHLRAHPGARMRGNVAGRSRDPLRVRGRDSWKIANDNLEGMLLIDIRFTAEDARWPEKMIISVLNLLMHYKDIRIRIRYGYHLGSGRIP